MDVNVDVNGMEWNVNLMNISHLVIPHRREWLTSIIHQDFSQNNRIERNEKKICDRELKGYRKTIFNNLNGLLQ